MSSLLYDDADEAGAGATTIYSKEMILGTYLGPVPQTARLLALVHSLNTSTASYQSQVYHHDLFLTKIRSQRINANILSNQQSGTEETTKSTSTGRDSPTTTSSTLQQASANKSPSVNNNSMTNASLQLTNSLIVFYFPQSTA